ncbi:phage protein NinX family protein [Enterobacter cloacae]|uniref:phage protein NinX family protein n=1 Tax=Enterobacter cloacae TaxID=550 RepID=UPI00298F1631|nr:phage protein NinX family protein [Enterobacter cloacae]MDW8497723.1 phage protein NinX family protein [Enterobacter cloacae subsp. cloacae]
MDYSQLSDFEINKRVAEATGTQIEETYQFVNGGEDIIDHMSGIVLMRKITSNRKHWKLYDPCNNPADAWQIIESNRISIRNRYEGDWKAENEWGESRFHVACNPLRAAMIVFLMMQDAKHA